MRIELWWKWDKDEEVLKKRWQGESKRNKGIRDGKGKERKEGEGE